jgi:hypothetical protein
MKSVKNIVAAALVLAAGLSTAVGQAPTVTVPGGTDILGEPFKAPGAWPNTGVSAAYWKLTTPPGGILNGIGSNFLITEVSSGPFRWTTGWTNEGDFDPNISVFNPADTRSFPGPFWDPFRDNCGGGGPVCANFGRYAFTSGPLTYAWALHASEGLIMMSIANNGRDNQNTDPLTGGPVGTLYAFAAAEPNDFRSGPAYNMVDGTHRTGNGNMYLSMNYVGETEEAIIDVSTAWFPFEAGWIGGYVRGQAGPNNEGQWLSVSNIVCAAPGLPASVHTWASTGDGRARLEVPVYSPANAYLFTTSIRSNNTDGPIVNTLSDGTGWKLAMRDNREIDPTGAVYATVAQSGYNFVVLPDCSRNLIAGQVDGATGAAVRSSGSFTVRRISAGVYGLTIPGQTKTTGALLLQVDSALPADPAQPDRTFLSYDFDARAGEFIINSRELVAGANPYGEDYPTRDSAFSFAFIDFNNPVQPPCPGDWNCDAAVDFNDLLAFLNDYNAQAPRADLNGDGVVDFNDLLAFLNLYNAAC